MEQLIAEAAGACTAQATDLVTGSANVGARRWASDLERQMGNQLHDELCDRLGVEFAPNPLDCMKIAKGLLGCVVESTWKDKRHVGTD